MGTPNIFPDTIFYVFLPPLVYYAALFIAPDDLRANARSIRVLAVGLVVATAAAVAAVMVGIGGVSLAAALVAGVVVALTDPVSATSVFKRLKVPERLSTTVEGEGLTNDGMGLVLYQGTVGIAVAGTVRPGHLAMTFLAAPAGGAMLGLFVAWLLVKVTLPWLLRLFELRADDFHTEENEARLRGSSGRVGLARRQRDTAAQPGTRRRPRGGRAAPVVGAAAYR
ncbi:cation:proton antiporter [Mycobacterium servetii]|uniref:Cation:proton antiporter n=1 Tax=Mycobacterium servetii TaxID=3237418 RepID=A0ABV4BYQ7_9MYCO